MERQAIIQPFVFTEDQKQTTLAQINAFETLLPFLVSLGEDGRKIILKIEEGLMTKQRNVYNTLVANPSVNNSKTLSMKRYGNQIENYDTLFSVHQRLKALLELIGDTLLAIGNEIAYQSNEGQKQIKRAAEDEAKNEKLYKNLMKPKAKLTSAQVKKAAEKAGFSKPPKE